jgi:hypothetical protein
LVLASTPFSSADYIYDFETFVNAAQVV